MQLPIAAAGTRAGGAGTLSGGSVRRGWGESLPHANVEEAREDPRVD